MVRSAFSRVSNHEARGPSFETALTRLLWMRKESIASLNRGAVVADQADVLNWQDVNDRSNILSTPCNVSSKFSLGFVMRSALSATLTVAACVFVIFGTTPPATAGTKPKTVTTIRPALQKPEETANAMAQAERLALQSDLAWIGQNNGAITGDVSERMIAAIKEFQKS